MEEKEFDANEFEIKIDAEDFESVNLEQCESEITDEALRACESCGAILVEGAMFCHICGAEVSQTSQKTCRECGAELPFGAAFCSSCGARVVKHQRNAVNAAKPSVKGERSELYKKITGIIKKSILLAAALMMFVISFLPIMSAEVELSDDIKHTVGFSAIDTVVFLMNTGESIPLDKLPNNDLYEDIVDIGKEYAEEWADNEELNRFESFVKKTVCLAVSMEDVDVSVTQIICTVFCFVYVIITFIMLLFATLDFILAFSSSKPRFASVTVMLMSAAVTFAPVVYFSYILAYHDIIMAIGTGLGILTLGTPIIYISTAVIVSMIVAFIALLYVAIDRFFISGAKLKVNVGEIIKRTFAIVFSLAMLIMIFAPVITTSAKTNFSGISGERRVESKITAPFLSSLYLSDESIDEFEDITKTDKYKMIRTLFSAFSSYTPRQYATGEAYAVNAVLLTSLILAFGGYEYSALIALSGIAVLLVGIMAALILWQNLAAVAIGKSPLGCITVTAKIFGILFAAIAVGVVIGICFVANYNAENADINYSVSIALGAILMLVASVATACVPMKKND